MEVAGRSQEPGTSARSGPSRRSDLFLLIHPASPGLPTRHLMIQRTFRTLISAFALGLAPAAAHAQLGIPTSVTYHLEAPSSFQEGCLPPCLCPILFYDNLFGTFDLTQVLPCPPSITCFTLTNIDWVMVDSFGAQRTVTGTGTYQLRDPQHRLELDVSIDGGPLQHHGRCSSKPIEDFQMRLLVHLIMKN